MKAQERKLSLNSTKFFVSLRRKLQSKGMKVQEIFTKQIFLRKTQQISQVQFTKIVTFSNCNLSSFESFDVYTQLKLGVAVPVKYFIAIYNKVVQRIPKDYKPPVNKTLQNQTEQLKNKIIKKGLGRLQKFIASTGLEYFQEVDQNNDCYLQPKQFNKLLILTGLKDFQDKQIRKQVIRKIYKHFPNGKLTKHDFAKLFKLDIQQLKKKKQNTLQIPVIPAVKIISPQKPKVPQSPHIKIPQKTEKPFQKLNIPKVQIINQIPKIADPKISPNKTLDLNKKDSNNSQQGEDIGANIKQIFPKAHSHYRLAIPEPQELQYFQALQNYLQIKKVFNDKQNPKTHIGTYQYASKLFNDRRYEIFMMASSVLQREKSRIGLAREIEPKDIIQGQVGDCYFLSSIASIISFYPEIIYDKILFSVNDSRYYVVKMFVDGQWKLVVTDDQFPMQYGKATFAKPHGNQIWVMLLEKCWAKIHGSYRAIQSGTPTEGFRALSGAPSQYISVQSKQDQIKIENRLQEAFTKRYVATVSGSKHLQSLSQAQQQKVGLISNHAYSFLKFLKLNGENVVKMRNPWGKTVWKGDWSFQSKKWTKQLRDKYNYNKHPDDGSFYISWPSFIKYFSSFVICKIDPTYLHVSLPLKVKPHKSTYLRIVVNEQGTYNFSIYQESKRRHANQPGYDYSTVRMVLLADNGPDYEYICSVNKQNSHCTTFQTQLKKGIYIAAVKVQWTTQKTHPIIFNSYGVQKIQIQQIQNTIAPVFKSQMIQSYSKKYPGKRKQYTSIKLPQAFNQTEISIERGIGYIRLCNPTGKEFTTTLSMNKCEGLKIIKPNKLPYQFIMKPKVEIVVGFWVSAKGYSYQSSESISYSY